MVRNHLGVQTSSLGLGSTLVRSRLGVRTSSLGVGSTLVRTRLGGLREGGGRGLRTRKEFADDGRTCQCPTDTRRHPSALPRGTWQGENDCNGIHQPAQPFVRSPTCPRACPLPHRKPLDLPDEGMEADKCIKQPLRNWRATHDHRQHNRTLDVLSMMIDNTAGIWSCCLL